MTGCRTPDVGLKSHRRLSGVLAKSPRLRDPTFQRIFGRAEEARGAELSLGHRLARSPDPTGVPESAEVRPLLPKPRSRMVPGFRLGTGLRLMQVQQSNLNKRNENKNNDNSTLVFLAARVVRSLRTCRCFCFVRSTDGPSVQFNE